METEEQVESPELSGTASTALMLQRTVGNQAVQRLLQRKPDVALTKTIGNEEELAKRGLNDAAFALLGKAGVSVVSGATATNGLSAGDYGLTFPESVSAKISAKFDKTNSEWSPTVESLTGHYSMQTRLLPGQSEITGPGGNTSKTNFCDQCEGLASLGNTVGNMWYMIRAVREHEKVHATRFKPALTNARTAIVTALEAVTIPHVAPMSKSAAIKQLRGDPNFQAELVTAQATWLTEVLKLVAGDHASGGPTDKAESAVTEPMRKSICAHAKKKKWGACPHC